MSLPPEGDWLPALTRWCASPVKIVGQSTLRGGYASGAIVGIALDVAGQRRSVVLKRTSGAEVAALRALAVVAGLDRPRLIAAGRDGAGDWLLMPHYDGSPLGMGVKAPGKLWDALARVHGHWLRRRPRGLPVVDARWWRALSEGRIALALRGAAVRGANPIYATAHQKVTSWARDRRILAALRLLPKTLVHGDPHRGNVLLASGAVTLIDWGNAKVAPAGLDLAVLRAQGSEAPASYRSFVDAVGGGADRGLLEVERHWADVTAHVAYLGFAADHLGAARVEEMVESAGTAVQRLGKALADRR